MNAQRVASVLDVYSAHAGYIQRAHVKTNPTNVQRVASTRNEWPMHATLDMR